MRRRALLATAGLTALAGCSSPLLPGLCSRPSFSEDRLDFETHEFPSVEVWWQEYPRGALLAREPAHLERFEIPEQIAENLGDPAEYGADLSADELAFIEETDFDESILVGVIVAAASGSTSARVTHVVDEGERVHCYVCIRRRSGYSDANTQARLIRVHDSWSPEEVRVTYTYGNDSTETFESAGTGLDSG